MVHKDFDMNYIVYKHIHILRFVCLVDFKHYKDLDIV